MRVLLFVGQFLSLFVIISFAPVPETNGISGIGGEEENEMTQIHANTIWYRANPTPEEHWQGMLMKRDVSHGPGERTALVFKLVIDDDRIPVYSARVEERLAEFTDVNVLVAGKLIDLRDEGFGIELWIGWIKKL